MNKRSLRFVDAVGQVVATAEVTDSGEHFTGNVDLVRTPRDWRMLFDEYEEVVEGQVLSLVDDVTDRIAQRRIMAIFDDGFESAVNELQVFPSTGAVSFVLATTAASMGNAGRAK